MEQTIDQYHKNLFECQERAVRLEADEEVTEDEIQKRISELRNHVINSEAINNRFRNTTLHRIWNSKPRFKSYGL